jgi:DNA-binding transcriptional ArsR family regulator
LTNRTLSIYNVCMDKVNIFKSLSNEARLQILEWLKDPTAHFGPQDGIDLIEVGVCVSQITEKLNMTQSTASQYLSTLQRAGLIKATRIGKWTYYKRDEEAIKNLGLYIQTDL